MLEDRISGEEYTPPGHTLGDTLIDIMSAMKGVLGSLDGQTEPIDRTEVNGVTVSTVCTVDCGYETAVVDAENVRIVQRYADREAALRGHPEWCEKMKTFTHVIDVGYGNTLKETLFELKRRVDNTG